MELNKERGPIYSNYDRDQPGNYSAVVDYAAPPRTADEIQFMLAHKITPATADPNDMRPAPGRTYQAGTAPLPAFLQSLSDAMAQHTQGQVGGLQSPGQQQTSWAYQNRNVRKNQSQSKAAIIGIVIWVLFMLVSMLMGILGR